MVGTGRGLGWGVLLWVGVACAAGCAGEPTEEVAPSAPLNVRGEPGLREVLVAWKPPASFRQTRVARYTVTTEPGGAQVSVDGEVMLARVTGLEDGTAYTFTVVAENAAGRSPPSEPSAPVSTFGVPGPPTDVQAEHRHHRTTVRWRPPDATGGRRITHYTLEVQPSGLTLELPTSTTAWEADVPLGGGLQRFSVRAHNEVGASAPGIAQVLLEGRTCALLPALSPSEGLLQLTTLHGLFLGDFDGDGRTDVGVSGEAGRERVHTRLFLGLGAGHFSGPYEPLPSMTSTSRVEGADVDADGDTDLVQMRGGLRVYLGGASREFVEATRGAIVTYGPWGLADMNGDGSLDLVLGVDQDGTVSVALGAGNGTFSAGPEQTHAEALVPGRPLLADVEGDGPAELLALSPEGAVCLLRREETGALPISACTPLPHAPAALAVLEVGGSTARELIVAHEDASTLTLWQHAADDTFTLQHTLSLPYAARLLATGDVDGDGAQDVVLGAPGQPLLLLRNARDGTLEPPVVLSGAVSPAHLTLGDVDGDGRADVALYDAERGLLLLRSEGTTLASFDSPALGFQAAGRPIGLVSLEKDALPGTALYSMAAGHRTLLSWQVVEGRLQPVTLLPDEGPARALARLEGGGEVAEDSLLVVTPQGVIQQHHRREARSLSHTQDLLTLREATTPTFAPLLAVGDVDLDGAEDLCAAVRGGKQVQCHLSSRPAEESGNEGTLFVPSISALALGDLDGDAQPELLTTGTDGSLLVHAFPWSLTAPSWVQHGLMGELVQVHVTQLGGDALPDMLYVTGWGEVRAASRTEEGEFPSRPLPALTEPLARLYPLDVDGDGRMDLLGVPHERPERLLLWWGTGEERFSPPVELTLARPLTDAPPLLQDVDGDGARELLLTQVDGWSVVRLACAP